MNNPFNSNNVHPVSIKQLQENWAWYFALGIGLVTLGTLAIIYSFTSTIFSMIYLGILLIIVGIFEGIQSFKMSLWNNFFLHLFLSILYLVSGFFIVLYPEVNALSLTLLLAIFFAVSGIVKVVFSLTHNIPHKIWLILNGALTLILGILIWNQWPSSGLWVIGTLVGIDILFTGWTWIMLALKAKTLKHNY